MAMTEGPATGRSNESSRCRTRPRSWPRTLAISPPSSSLERDFCRRRLAHQKGPEDDAPRRDQKSETTAREKWLQKRPFCLRAINFGFRKTAWWANQGSVDVPACFTSSKAVGAVFGVTPRRHQGRCFRLGQRC